MKRAAILWALGALSVSVPAVAQEDPAPNCADPRNQMEMNECASVRYRDADKILNAAYARAMKRAEAQDLDLGAISPDWSGAVQALKKAQRAWIQFRDGQCELAGFEARGGSMEPLLIFTCLANLTRDRTQELNDLLNRN